jgi:hypothetical protein
MRAYGAGSDGGARDMMLAYYTGLNEGVRPPYAKPS